MEEKYCILSRVRIARNINGFPFTNKMNESEMLAVCDTVKGALGNEFSYINFSALPLQKKQSFVERHLVSPEFAISKNKTALFLNPERDVSVMVGEEDHIRIQAFAEGLSIDSALQKAMSVEELIEKTVDYMFNEQFGYITKCPTNLGTGMRASVMMYLPITVNQNTISAISSDLARSGMTIRGLYGEGSNSFASLYQISNNVTMGLSEKDTADRVTEIVKSLSKTEEEGEKRYFSMNPDIVRDEAMRALGLLRSSYMVSSSEAGQLISRVMMGNNLSVIDIGKTNIEIFSHLESILPATLSESEEKHLESERERDVFRAEKLREYFK